MKFWKYKIILQFNCSGSNSKFDPYQEAIRERAITKLLSRLAVSFSPKREEKKRKFLALNASRERAKERNEACGFSYHVVDDVTWMGLRAQLHKWRAKCLVPCESHSNCPCLSSTQLSLPTLSFPLQKTRYVTSSHCLAA